MCQVSAPSPLAAARGEAYRRRHAGDLTGAAAALTSALERVRPAYGEDHPEVLAASHELARLHMTAGEPAMARRVLEEALAAGQRRFGDGDALLLAISFDLATVAEELGNRHEARRNFGRVAAAGPAVLGHDHWTVRAARSYLDGTTLAGTTLAGTTVAGPTVAGTAVTDPGFRAADKSALPDVSTAQSPRSRPMSAPTSAPTAPPPAPKPLSPHVRARLDPVPRELERGRRGRGAAVAAGVAAVAAVLAAVLAAVAVLNGDDGTDAGPTARGTPTVSIGGDPPTDVKVTRDGDALVLTWTDPAPGRVSFVITGGKEGEELRFVGQVTSGATPRFPVYGYNPALAYCFQVAAVYSTTELGVAQPVCTSDTPGR
jgi:hypothetical protein